MTAYTQSWTQYMVGTAEQADDACDELFLQGRQWRIYPVDDGQWRVDVVDVVA